MNRTEFMDRLENLLTGLPIDERREALQYYTDYFEDAGGENEQQIICELGNPEKVAETIRADIQGNGINSSQFTEQGYKDTRFEQKNTLAKKEEVYKEKSSGYTYESTNQGSYQSGDSQDNINDERLRRGKVRKIILILVLIFVVAPIGISLILGVLVAIIGIVFAISGLLAGLVIGSVSLMLAGLFVVGIGLTKLVTMLPVALVTSGIGLVVSVVGAVVTVGTLKLCRIAYPAMFGLIIRICRWPFERKVVS